MHMWYEPKIKRGKIDFPNNVHSNLPSPKHAPFSFAFSTPNFVRVNKNILIKNN